MKRRACAAAPAVGFTYVEYLKSDGLQVIRTDIRPDNTTGCELEYMSLDSSVDAPIVSATRLTSTNDNRFYVPYVASGTAYCGWNTWITMGKGSDLGIRMYAALNFMNCRAAFLKGDGVSMSVPLNITLNPVESLNIFAYENHQSVRGRKCLLYSVRISRGENIVHDLRPAVSSVGEAGLLDRVSGIFHTNTGEGNFVPGPVLGA